MKNFLFIFLFTINLYCNNELLAFPSAEGCGAYTKGGRGGVVYEVTNLNDRGKGSFREACEANGSRVVVFRVGGTIDLKGKDIVIKNDNITIAGQTATGDGIQIKNGGIIIKANEVIVRYLRVRLGVDISSKNQDTLSIRSPNRHNRKKNIIIDHLSLFWGVDETLDAGSFSDNITIQWSIIAEGLHCSIYNDNGKGESWKPCKELNGKKIWAHSRGVMVSEDSRNVTLHHNLIFRNYKRNPLIQSSDADIVNNVIVNYQYQVYVEPFKAKVRANFIGNYFRSHIHKRPPIRVIDFDNGYDGDSGVYYRDNYDSFFRSDDNQSETDIRYLQYSLDKDDKDGHIQDKNSSYSFIKVKTQSVREAYSLVLEKVGAIYPNRDKADKRVIDFVKSGKAPNSFVNNPQEVGGFPNLKGDKAPLDSDHDGIPDKWEKNHNLNPFNPSDGKRKELSSEGYTNLEVYLNSLVKGI